MKKLVFGKNVLPIHFILITLFSFCGCSIEKDSGQRGNTTVILEDEQLAALSNIELDNHAIFFANQDYSGSNTFSDLKHPFREVEEIERILTDEFEFKSLIYRDLNNDSIVSVLNGLKNRKFGDQAQLLLYFSGHGDFHEDLVQGYYVPKGDGNYENSFSLDPLPKILNLIDCKHILLAIDACYSGAVDPKIALELVQKGQRGRNIEEENTSRSSFAGLEGSGRPEFKMDANQIIFAQLEKKSRLYMSSGRNGLTPDNSHFAATIIKGLENAYRGTEGFCTYEDLVAGLSHVTPVTYSERLLGDDGGGFIFLAKRQADSRQVTKSEDTILKSRSKLENGMLLITGGEFAPGRLVGNNSDSKYSERLEPFLISLTEVSAREYLDYCQSSNAAFPKKLTARTPDSLELPIRFISWRDAINYCNWKSKKEGLQPYYGFDENGSVFRHLDRNGYRLPSEAEWEVAASAAYQHKEYAGTSADSKLREYANFLKKESKPVAVNPRGISPNNFGLFHMSGNVAEFCWDAYVDNLKLYSNRPIKDSQHKGLADNLRVVRGGGYNDPIRNLIISKRALCYPDGKSGSTGFRLARTHVR